MGNTKTRFENNIASETTGNVCDTDAIAASTTTTQRHVLNRPATVTAAATGTTTLYRVGEQQPQEQHQRQQQTPLITSGSSSGSVIRNSLPEATTTVQTQTHQSAATAVITSLAPRATAEPQQRSRQLSTWSLGSLRSARLSFTFCGTRTSFRHRNRGIRKSLSSLQDSRRYKTQWHRPITNAIFSSHFKESSCNEQFHIEHLVATGAFGVVFKVAKKSNVVEAAEPNSYALKVIKKFKVIEENSVQQIKDEADIQKVCGHHPFIVQQIDLWQNRHNLHILSEYVPNGELFSKISSFSTDLVRLYVAEIALAIDFLHNAGIIYRDAKPENVLLTQQFHIKLTDFGLSKWLKFGATTRTMCGTFKYMAPEILRGEPYGHAVDWWALGVIVCQMLTQKCPNIKRYLQRQCNNDNNDNDTLSNAPSFARINGCLMDGEHDFLPDAVQQLPYETRDVLQRLLTLEPRQRLRSVMALQRIALYKGYKVEAKHLLSQSPLAIMSRDNIRIYEPDSLADQSNAAFNHF